jgi:hypothetical protein
LPSLRPEAPLFPLPLLELSRLGPESFSLAVPRQERTEQQPAGTEQLEVLSQLLVRLEVALAVDELLLTVAAEWELGKASLARSMRLAWAQTLERRSVKIRRSQPAFRQRQRPRCSQRITCVPWTGRSCRERQYRLWRERETQWQPGQTAEF